MTINIGCSLKKHSFFGPLELTYKNDESQDVSLGNVKYHYRITAFFWRFFGQVIDVQDSNHNVYHLQRNSVLAWVKSHHEGPLQPNFPAQFADLIRAQIEQSKINRTIEKFNEGGFAQRFQTLLSSYPAVNHALIEEEIKAAGHQFSYKWSLFTQGGAINFINILKEEAANSFLKLEVLCGYATGAVLKLANVQIQDRSTWTSHARDILKIVEDASCLPEERNQIENQLNRKQRALYEQLRLLRDHPFGDFYPVASSANDKLKEKGRALEQSPLKQAFENDFINTRIQLANEISRRDALNNQNRALQELILRSLEHDHGDDSIAALRSRLNSLVLELRPSFVDANKIQALKKTLKEFLDSKIYSTKKAAYEQKMQTLNPVEKEFVEKIDYSSHHYKSTFLECLSELQKKLPLKEMNAFLETLENKLK